MRQGKIRITNKYIADALEFPSDWIIEKITPISSSSDQSEMLISGKDFPEADNNGDIENVKLIVHKEARTFVIKSI